MSDVENSALAEAMAAIEAAKNAKEASQARTDAEAEDARRQEEAALRAAEEEQARIAQAADDVLEAEAIKIRAELDEHDAKRRKTVSSEKTPEEFRVTPEQVAESFFQKKLDELNKMKDTLAELDRALEDPETDETLKAVLESSKLKLVEAIKALDDELKEIDKIDAVGKPNWRSPLPEATLAKMSEVRREEEERKEDEQWANPYFLRSLVQGAVHGVEESKLQIRYVLSTMNEGGKDGQRSQKKYAKVVEAVRTLGNEETREFQDRFKTLIKDLGVKGLLERMAQEKTIVGVESVQQRKDNLDQLESRSDGISPNFDAEDFLKKLLVSDSRSSGDYMDGFVRNVGVVAKELSDIAMTVAQLLQEAKQKQTALDKAIVFKGGKKQELVDFKQRLIEALGARSLIGQASNDSGVYYPGYQEAVEKDPVAFLTDLQLRFAQAKVRMEILQADIGTVREKVKRVNIGGGNLDMDSRKKFHKSLEDLSGDLRGERPLKVLKY